MFLAFVLAAALTQQQPLATPTIAGEPGPVSVNPIAVAFTCPDHKLDTAHEIDIINEAGEVVATLQGGDPDENERGEVIIPIDIGPYDLGVYTVVVRAVVSRKSADSGRAYWERALRATSQPNIRRVEPK